ncbi:sugar phosphate isomerase/epimerase family protein [Anaerolentibacter hominis]|uniref:sugar phosphate isomerase/epimerase family protein n=1 Tax=Anaerolentibacter hominis TaxID=3079009 RepID=UPI0031B8629E
MIKYGVHKLTWGRYFDPNDLKTFFHQAGELGAETVEIRPTEEMLKLNKHKIREITKMAEAEGLEILYTYGFPPNLDMRSPDPFIRSYAVDFLKKGIRCVAEAGGREIGSAGIYSCWPACYDFDMVTPEIKYERRNRSVECVREAARTAEEYGVMLNLEVINRFENYLINTVDEGISFCEDVDSPYCSLLLDVFHMNIEEEDIPAAIRLAGKRIGHFHVSEPNRAIPHHSKRICWEEIGGALREIGYDRTVTIEAAVACEGEATYSMRMWRDLIGDTSLTGRLVALRQGLDFIRRKFEHPQ